VNTFRTAWVNTLLNASKDTRFGPAERLMSLASALEAEKDLRADVHTIPDDMRQLARQTVEVTLATPRDKYSRGDIVHAAVGVYETLGDNRAAYDLLEQELPNSKTPYYYMSYLAEIDESEGRPEKALSWTAKAYEAAQGPATKIQWGEIYVRGLIRLAPDDGARIRRIAIQVADDAAAPQALHARARARVNHMTQALEQWATTPERQQIVTAVRERLPHA
jgi:protein disulfide-isomerase